MPIDKSKITNEIIKKAMECDTPDELIALAKTAGIDITKAEAEAYLDGLDDLEMNSDTLDKVAGGSPAFCSYGGFAHRSSNKGW